MQLLGGRGYMENNLAPQILRDARVLSVGEGPNEPLTTQVGRKMRHTGAISSYLLTDRDGSDLNAVLAGAIHEITDRCLSGAGPFADRSKNQLWAEWLIGGVTCEALLLAAMRAAHRRSPIPHLRRALDWSEHRFARTLQRARDGRPEDRLMPTSGEISALVEHYAGAIGDLEEGLAGEEAELDSLLSQKSVSPTNPLVENLPGHAAGPGDGPLLLGKHTAPEQSDVEKTQARRELLAKVLRQRLEVASTEL
jgi:Acyl-CoA dehydrogenase, C-terminal domain